MKKILLIILVVSTDNIYCNEIHNRDRELLLSHPKNKEVETSLLKKYPESYQAFDSLLQERNKSSGLNSPAYFTAQDSSRFSVSYSLSQDFEDFTKVQSFDLTYLNQFDNSFRELWWGVQLKSTTAKYNAIADENPSAVRGDNLQSLASIGAGIAHRFKALSVAFKTQRTFEILSFFTNYISHLDNTDSAPYTGYGLTTKYTLSRRTSQNFFYAANFSYDWAFVEKTTPRKKESLTDRSLVFAWTTFGLELGYIF